MKEWVYIINLSSRNYLRERNRFMPPILEHIRAERKLYGVEYLAEDIRELGVVKFSSEFEMAYKTIASESVMSELEYLACNISHRSSIYDVLGVPRTLLGWIHIYVISNYDFATNFAGKVNSSTSTANSNTYRAAAASSSMSLKSSTTADSIGNSSGTRSAGESRTSKAASEEQGPITAINICVPVGCTARKAAGFVHKDLER